MKKLAVVVLAVFLLAGCATIPQYGGYKSPPYIGMSEAEFRTAAVFAYRINETVTKYGTSRQYVFQDHVNPKYVYFENGILTAMQN
jgi:uncharacterized lipoprotein YajG